MHKMHFVSSCYHLQLKIIFLSFLFRFQAIELIRQITPKRCEYEFLTKTPKVFRIQLQSFWYINEVSTTFLSKVFVFDFSIKIKMGVAMILTIATEVQNVGITIAIGAN